MLTIDRVIACSVSWIFIIKFCYIIVSVAGAAVFTTNRRFPSQLLFRLPCDPRPGRVRWRRTRRTKRQTWQYVSLKILQGQGQGLENVSSRTLEAKDMSSRTPSLAAGIKEQLKIDCMGGLSWADIRFILLTAAFPLRVFPLRSFLSHSRSGLCSAHLTSIGSLHSIFCYVHTPPTFSNR